MVPARVVFCSWDLALEAGGVSSAVVGGDKGGELGNYAARNGDAEGVGAAGRGAEDSGWFGRGEGRALGGASHI
jgi:hypothetical protein